MFPNILSTAKLLPPPGSARCVALGSFTVHQSSRAPSSGIQILTYETESGVRNKYIAARLRGHGRVTLKASVVNLAGTFVSRVSVSTAPLADICDDSHSILSTPLSKEPDIRRRPLIAALLRRKLRILLRNGGSNFVGIISRTRVVFIRLLVRPRELPHFSTMYKVVQ